MPAAGLPAPAAPALEGDGVAEPYTLRWEAPSGRRAVYISGYAVQMRADATGWRVLSEDSGSKRTRLVLQESLLPRGKEVQFRVAACAKGTGHGAYSEPSAPFIFGDRAPEAAPPASRRRRGSRERSGRAGSSRRHRSTSRGRDVADAPAERPPRADADSEEEDAAEGRRLERMLLSWEADFHARICTSERTRINN